MELFTDALGKDIWGAYWAGRWISNHWSTTQQGETTIAWKELYAITMAVNTRSTWWQRKKILIYCDNQTVVNVWEKRTCKSPEIMALIRMIYSLPGLSKPSSPPPAMQILWCGPVNSAHVSIRSKCLLIILLTFQHLAHTSFIFDSLICLCGQKPISIL